MSVKMMTKARLCFDELINGKFGDKIDTYKWVLMLANGKFQKDPFTTEDYERMRYVVKDVYGMSSEDMMIVDGQVLRLKALALILKRGTRP